MSKEYKRRQEVRNRRTKNKRNKQKKVMTDVNPTILIIKLKFNKVNILIKYKNVRID